MFGWNSSLHTPEVMGRARNRLLARREEEDYVPPERRLAGESDTGLPGLFEGGVGELRAGDSDLTRGRTTLERVLSPIEAPQQFLYSLTRNVADDGFTVGGAWDALKHGANYFNPWSDAERISEDEIADIFGMGGGEGAGKFMKNLAIGLLYDPLWAGALVRGVGKGVAAGGRAIGALAGGAETAAGARAIAAGARTGEALAATGVAIDRWTNPVVIAGRGLSKAKGAAAPVAEQLARGILKSERYENFAFSVNKWLKPPSKLLPREWYEAFGRKEVGMQELQIQAAAIIKSARNAGPGASDLMTEALLTREIRDAVVLGYENVPKAAKTTFDGLISKMDKLGIDQDLFIDNLQNWYALSDTITEGALRSGLLAPEAQRQLSGRYLRNQYISRQSEVDVRRRLNHLIELGEQGRLPPGADLYSPGQKVFQEVELRKQLEALASEWSDVTPRNLRLDDGTVLEDFAYRFQSVDMLPSTVKRRYFPQVQNKPGQRRFNVENFMEDLRPYMQENRTHSVSDAMEFVRTEMFGDVPVPPEIMATIANYMAKGTTDLLTIPKIEKALTAGRGAAQATFREYGANAKAIIDREALPEEIAKVVLGRRDTAFPRMINYVDEVGGEVTLHRFFDDVSGAVRLDETVFNRINDTLNDAVHAARKPLGEVPRPFQSKARELLDNSPEVLEATAKLERELAESMPWASAERISEIIADARKGKLKAGDLLGYDGSGLATLERTGDNSRQVMNSAFGSLDGMHVPESVWHTLQRYVDLTSDVTGAGARNVGPHLAKVAESLTSAWKMSKIVMDAGAQVRDTIGSLIQMEIMGVGKFSKDTFRKATQALKGIREGNIGEYVRNAHDIGYNVLGTTMSSAELGRTATRLAGELPPTSIDWIDDATGVFKNIIETARGLPNTAANIYQTRESFFRLYTYISKTDELTAKFGRALTRDETLDVARQAAEFTNRTLYNYADVPAAMEFVRRTGIAPFITFPVKAAGQLVDVVYNTPWNVLKYDRTLDAWNNSWAGGDEAFAREIEALPPHARDSMVMRLPWETTEGNPMYLDLSYFLPWAAVRDLVVDAGKMVNPFKDSIAEFEEAEPELVGQIRGSYPGASAGGGIFSPVITQILDIKDNKDGFGRPIWSDTDPMEVKAEKISRALWQFMAPPTAPGGSTSDSVFRAMMGAARTNPEPVNWLETLGLAGRLGDDSNVLNRYGESQTSRALIKSSEDPTAQGMLGLASLFLPVTEADASRTERDSAMFTQGTANNILAELREVASNPNYSESRKKAEIERLKNLHDSLQESNRQHLRRLRGY